MQKEQLKDSALLKFAQVITALALLNVTYWLGLGLFEDDSAPQIQRSLMWLVVWGLDVAVFAIGVGLLFGLRSVYAGARSISKLGWVLFAAILLISSLLTFLVAPKTNRIYFDEHIYLQIGQSVAETDRLEMVTAGRASPKLESYLSEYNKEPGGYAYYQSRWFTLFGASEEIAHVANNVAYLGGVAALFFLCLLLGFGEAAGLFAALCYALTPIVAQWSHTCSAELATAASAVLALLAAAWVGRMPSSVGARIFFVGIVSFAAQFRPEAVLLIPTCLLLIGVYPIANSSLFENARRELSRPGLYWMLAGLGIALFPNILHLLTVANEPWGSAGVKFSWKFFEENIKVNGPFYFVNERFPVLFSLFALIGVFAFRKTQQMWVVALWFLWAVGIFVPFYAGSYNYGADVRFSIVSAPALAVLAGLGAAVCMRWCSVRAPKQWQGAAIVPVVLFASWVPFLSLIGEVGGEAEQARAGVSADKRLREHLPDDGVVLSHLASQWLLWGKNAAQTSLALQRPEVVNKRFFKEFPGGVYYHYSYWCNVPHPSQNVFCNYVEDNYTLELVEKYPYKDFEFALYRVLGPK